MNPQAKEKISLARSGICFDHPFWANLILPLPCIEDASIPTACTNGKCIKYNPDFVNSLPQEQVKGLLVHEVWHCGLGHLWRLPATRRGNIAGDYAANNWIDIYNKESGGHKIVLPPHALIKHEWDGLSAEEILAKIPLDEDKKGGGNDPSEFGGFESPEAASPEEKQASIREWNQKVVQAATAATMQQGRGNLPSCITQLVDDLVNPVVPWNVLLERFVDETAANNYSWMKPDRRYLSQDIILPDLLDETLGEIVVAIDTSGSIFCDRATLTQFNTELNSLILKCSPNKVHLIYCDAEIQKVDEIERGETVTITPVGGGGTRFEPVGEYLEEHGINPRVVIYLTDLYGSFPETPWPWPTIWAVYGNPTGVAPFGDTVHINPSKNE